MPLEIELMKMRIWTVLSKSYPRYLSMTSSVAIPVMTHPHEGRDTLAQNCCNTTIHFLKATNPDSWTMNAKGELEVDLWEDDDAEAFAQNKYADFAEFTESRRKAVEAAAGPVRSKFSLV
ncbi:MAG: hypothetical protein Q9195_002154 [Heterodermia aff. obscurata]